MTGLKPEVYFIPPPTIIIPLDELLINFAALLIELGLD